MEEAEKQAWLANLQRALLSPDSMVHEFNVDKSQKERGRYPKRRHNHPDNLLFNSVLCNLYQSWYNIVLPI